MFFFLHHNQKEPINTTDKSSSFDNILMILIQQWIRYNSRQLQKSTKLHYENKTADQVSLSPSKVIACGCFLGVFSFETYRMGGTPQILQKIDLNVNSQQHTDLTFVHLKCEINRLPPSPDIMSKHSQMQPVL